MRVVFFVRNIAIMKKLFMLSSCLSSITIFKEANALLSNRCVALFLSMFQLIYCATCIKMISVLFFARNPTILASSSKHDVIFSFVSLSGLITALANVGNIKVHAK